jgi:hypothetical protein
MLIKETSEMYMNIPSPMYETIISELTINTGIKKNTIISVLTINTGIEKNGNDQSNRENKSYLNGNHRFSLRGEFVLSTIIQTEINYVEVHISGVNHLGRKYLVGMNTAYETWSRYSTRFRMPLDVTTDYLHKLVLSIHVI